VFGAGAAERLAAAHQEHVDVAFGRTLTAVTDTGTQLELALDDTTADGGSADHRPRNHPDRPRPLEDGVIVDGKLRTATPGVYSAGGVAAHYDTTLGAWRIDHWSDAAAQGEHAARTMLADLGAGTHPGDYQPRAPFTATCTA
jgi:3-phenylpropionate/trans-cinnamate dioxygenase ferredoxin reductase subunit